MSAPKILDELIEAFVSAVRRGDKPLLYAINKAAELELLMDERVYRSMSATPTIDGLTFCGIPASIEDDGGSSPMFTLRVAKIDRFAVQLDEPSHESQGNRHSVTLCDVTQSSQDSS